MLSWDCCCFLRASLNITGMQGRTYSVDTLLRKAKRQPRTSIGTASS
jgi:hypothetical protein